MTRKLFKNNGMTLIELVLTVALISLITLLLFIFFQFNYLTFGRSNEKYNLQTSLTNISRFIEEELKYATEIKIYENKPDKESEKNMIYLEDKVIKINGNDKTDKDMVLITSLEFLMEGNNITISINGESVDERFNHNIDSTIELLNFNSETECGGFYIVYKNKGAEGF